jgi:hypothetical protein
MDILEQRLRCRTSGTYVYSHMYGDHDDSRNPHPSQDAVVDSFVQGSGNSAARRLATVAIPFSYRALREATRERERWRAMAKGGRRTKEIEVAAREERHMGNWCVLSPKSTSLYRGRGCTLPPPQGSPRAAARGGEGGGDQGWGGPAGPQNPNPGRPEPGV